MEEAPSADGAPPLPLADLSGVHGLIASLTVPKGWMRDDAVFLWKDLCRVASYRRTWVEVRAAWSSSRALGGGSIVDGVRPWIASMYGAWMTLALRRHVDTDRRSVSLRRLLGAALCTADSSDERRWWQVALDRLQETTVAVTEYANRIAAHNSLDRHEATLTWAGLDRAVRKFLVLATRAVQRLGWPPIGAGARQFDPRSILRHPWIEPQWTAAAWPRDVVERIGEHYPRVDRLSATQHDRLREGMADVVAHLRANVSRAEEVGSPISGVLGALGLPDTDAAVQYVRDELASRGLDWRHDPVPTGERPRPA